VSSAKAAARGAADRRVEVTGGKSTGRRCDGPGDVIDGLRLHSDNCPESIG
jgi:hypothetical protein